MSLTDLFTTPAPDVAVEIDRTHVAAARLSMRGGQAVITAHASERLPAGMVVPGLLTPNIPDVPALAQMIRGVVTQLGGSKPTGVSLVIPDTVAKDRKSTRLNSSHLVISYAVIGSKKTT